MTKPLASLPAPTKTACVLLLCEEAAVVETLKAFFRHYLPDYELMAQTHDGLGAVDLAKVTTVIFDLELPGARGLATLRGLRAAHAGVPVLVLASSEEDARIGEALSEGALDFLVRGRLEDGWLLRTLRHAFDQHRLYSGLEAAEEGFEALVMSNADGMVMLDAEGTIRFSNPAAEALFGRAKDKLVGSSFGFPVVTGRSVEIDILRPGGAPTIAEMQVTRTVWHGEGLFLASLRDVTQRKQAEEELARLNLELETRIRERTNEVRSLALDLVAAEAAERGRIAQLLHDDLQQLLIAAQFTLRGLRAHLDDEGRAALVKAEAILKEAVVSCRLTAANQVTPFVAGETLEQAFSNLAEQMRRQLDFHVAVKAVDALALPDAPLRDFLFQVTRELLLNVVKHAGVLKAELSLYREGSVITLEVSDEGEGFDPDEAEAIGTGLGLTGLRKRALLFGGDLDVTSERGAGTVVRVRLSATDNENTPIL